MKGTIIFFSVCRYKKIIVTSKKVTKRNGIKMWLFKDENIYLNLWYLLVDHWFKQKIYLSANN